MIQVRTGYTQSTRFIEDCKYSKWSHVGTDACIYIPTHLVLLFSGGTCSTGDVRLVGGVTSGRVEMCSNGTWRVFCPDGWDSVDAQVLCTQLGFSSSGEAHDHSMPLTVG